MGSLFEFKERVNYCDICKYLTKHDCIFKGQNMKTRNNTVFRGLEEFDKARKHEQIFLFVYDLNPLTCEEDLDNLFSKYGELNSVELLKHSSNGHSLCAGFIGFNVLRPRSLTILRTREI